MINKIVMIDRVKECSKVLLEMLGNDYPLAFILEPVLKPMINNYTANINSFIELLADKSGNIDIETIVTEMFDRIINTKPFTMNIKHLGDVQFGSSQIKFSVPFINKELVLNRADIEIIRDILINKQN